MRIRLLLLSVTLLVGCTSPERLSQSVPAVDHALYSPWVVSVSLPPGALAFLLRRVLRTPQSA
jgi:hypothetical protein